MPYRARTSDVLVRSSASVVTSDRSAATFEVRFGLALEALYAASRFRKSVIAVSARVGVRTSETRAVRETEGREVGAELTSDPDRLLDALFSSVVIERCWLNSTRAEADARARGVSTGGAETGRRGRVPTLRKRLLYTVSA